MLPGTNNNEHNNNLNTLSIFSPVLTIMNTTTTWTLSQSTPWYSQQWNCSLKLFPGTNNNELNNNLNTLSICSHQVRPEPPSQTDPIPGQQTRPDLKKPVVHAEKSARVSLVSPSSPQLLCLWYDLWNMKFHKSVTERLFGPSDLEIPDWSLSLY